MPKVTHKAIQKICREMAAAVYEEQARHNEFYKLHRTQNQFVNEFWPTFMDTAKMSLVEILNKEYPDDQKAKGEKLKDEAYTILVQNFSLPKGNAVTSIPSLIH